MANIKSAKKAVKQNKVRRLRNISRTSDIKTACKKVEDALQSQDTSLAKEMLRAVESKISRARGKGLFKKNTASRKVSCLARKVAAAQKTPESK